MGKGSGELEEGESIGPDYIVAVGNYDVANRADGAALLPIILSPALVIKGGGH